LENWRIAKRQFYRVSPTCENNGPEPLPAERNDVALSVPRSSIGFAAVLLVTPPQIVFLDTTSLAIEF
jgi:hypothetical protein